MAGDLTIIQVGGFLRNLGHYRVVRTQIVGALGEPNGIGGSHYLALGLRETNLKNINGGAVWVDGHWEEAPPYEQDTGVFQISRVHHPSDLKRMPAVKEGTWTPVIGGKTAFDPGYCPRFEESLQFLDFEFSEALAFADDYGVAPENRPRFAIAAHNGGKGGALRGWREGNVDKYTTGGDYSAWVLHHTSLVKRWLRQHPTWKP